MGLNQVTKAFLAEYQGNTVYHMVGVGSEREYNICVHVNVYMYVCACAHVCLTSLIFLSQQN